MKERKIIYYEDPLHDEFSTAQITPIPIDENYVYIRTGWFKKLTHFFWYRTVATPLAFCWLKVHFLHRIKGRKKLKGFRKKGLFLYGNHTQAVADALIPTMISTPQDTYVIVHPNNVSMPVLGKITPSMGALPLPDNLSASRNFIRAVQQRLEEGNAVAIYPEAHIWPYYTGIRPFPDQSFHYPVKFQTPVFCFTNVYRKRRLIRRPRIVTYVDGPFYPAPGTPAQQRADLREQVYACMTRRSRLSDAVYVEYRKKET